MRRRVEPLGPFQIRCLQHRWARLAPREPEPYTLGLVLAAIEAGPEPGDGEQMLRLLNEARALVSLDSHSSG